MLMPPLIWLMLLLIWLQMLKLMPTRPLTLRLTPMVSF